MRVSTKLRAVVTALVLGAGLAACGQGEAVFPEKRQGDTSPTYGDKPRETIWGEGGMNIFGGKKKADEQGAGIGVNAFLWRATLDTISFMPLSSADAFGGVIITDWWSAPEAPAQRMKVTVLIMDRTLRADGVRVAVFRQTRQGAADWVDSAVESATASELENAILSRARELRSQAKDQK